MGCKHTSKYRIVFHRPQGGSDDLIYCKRCDEYLFGYFMETGGTRSYPSKRYDKDMATIPLWSNGSRRGAL